MQHYTLKDEKTSYFEGCNVEKKSANMRFSSVAENFYFSLHDTLREF